MARIYNVAVQSESLPVGFNIVTIPSADDNLHSATGSVNALGLSIYEPFTIESPADASTRLANLVAFTLWKGHKRGAARVETMFEAHVAEFHDFMTCVARQDFVPIESSPMHGSNLEALMKASSLMGFASFLEGYGLIHHDPVICIVVVPMTVIVGATVGVGEGLRERAKRLLGASRKTKQKLPP